jgi:small-conductance mechanosensitive channel
MAFIEAMQAFFTKISIALLTLFIGFIIAKLAGKIAKRIMAEAELNRILVAAGFKPLSDAFGVIIEYIIYAATILVILQQFGLTTVVLSILGAIAAVIIIFSLLLAIRDFIPNAVAGLFVRKKLKKFLGKKVQIGTVRGRLENIGIVNSTLRDKDEHCVPHFYTSRKEITRPRAN